MVEKSICRSCASEDLQDFGPCAPSAWRTATMGGHDPGRLRRCRTCGLGQRQPVPDAQTLLEMYRQTPSDEWSYKGQVNAAWAVARQGLVSRFGEQSDIAILDVGCHTGLFLSGLPQAWRRYGIESAREPIRIATEQHAVSVIGERIESIGGEWDGRFDVVTMFDVAEHLVNPDAGIASAARLLKPGGVLILSTGNFDAWTWRVLGGGHWYLQTPQHLSILSPRYVTHAAASHSLRLVGTQRIPHHLASARQRLRDAIETIYWGMRIRRGVYRLPHRILQSLPGLRYLRHLQSVPWTMSMSDHFLATLERQPAAANE